MLHTIANALKRPSARAIEAVVMCILRLVSDGPVRQSPKMSQEAARRLGLILAELATHASVPQRSQRRINEWLLLHKKLKPNISSHPIGLSAGTTTRSIQISMRRRPSENQTFWGVYGKVDVREDLLEDLAV